MAAPWRRRHRRRGITQVRARAPRTTKGGRNKMYELSRTVPVNEPAKLLLNRHEVWSGLMMKAHDALPYVPQMKKCEVVEQGDGWLVRDILLGDEPLREKVTFEPENRVIFERVAGNEPGRIENILGEDENGNLTLTFAFALTRKGLEGDADAEQKHFAPMEGMYFGAVASTLDAVRQTVQEQGREALPLADCDSSGDNRWIYEYYRAADSLDLDRLLAQHTDDVRLTFGNNPTAVGKEQFAAAIGGLWSMIKGMSHSLTGAWSVNDDQVGIAEAIVMYTRPDDSTFTMKACTTLRRRDGKVADMRIHADVNGL
jgi:ketosteroid isomerase-like protein